MLVSKFKNSMFQRDYERVAESEDLGNSGLQEGNSDRVQSPSSFISKRSTWPQLVLFSLGLVTIAVLFSYLGYQVGGSGTTKTSTVLPSGLHCGNSSVEAMARGCKFDILTNTWFPKECSDPETNSEFQSWVFANDRLRQSFPYYRDTKGLEQIASEEELSEMVGEVVYTTMENHLGHCTFLMRRLHRVLDDKDGAIAHNSLKHTIHCSHEILKAVGDSDCESRGRITSGFRVEAVGC